MGENLQKGRSHYHTALPPLPPFPLRKFHLSGISSLCSRTYSLTKHGVASYHEITKNVKFLPISFCQFHSSHSKSWENYLVKIRFGKILHYHNFKDTGFLHWMLLHVWEWHTSNTHKQSECLLRLDKDKTVASFRRQYNADILGDSRREDFDFPRAMFQTVASSSKGPRPPPLQASLPPHHTLQICTAVPTNMQFKTEQCTTVYYTQCTNIAILFTSMYFVAILALI